MISTYEKKIVFYASLLMTIILNMAKLSSLWDSPLAVSVLGPFNLEEYIFQSLFHFLFCLFIFFFNLRLLTRYSSPNVWWVLIGSNLFLTLLAEVFGAWIQEYIFYENFTKIVWLGYFRRFSITFILVHIVMRIIVLVKESREKEAENERLRNASLNTELQLLKQQLNPHFFFNSLNSLSSVVRENPELARHYIHHLSKVYRYALASDEKSIVSLGEELDAIHSYIELLKMRFEENIRIKINIPEETRQVILPHLSLQPLLENAAKHNRATSKEPLEIVLYIEEGTLVIKNNKQSPNSKVTSSGLGLSNLNERYRILFKQSIEIESTEEFFSVKLPLQKAHGTHSNY